MKKSICFILVLAISFTFFQGISRADTVDEIVTIPSFSSKLKDERKIDYLIHDNKIYISDFDGAAVSGVSFNINTDTKFYRYYPGLQKVQKSDGKDEMVIGDNVYRGIDINMNIPSYTYNGTRYFPLREFMNKLATSYFYDSYANIIYFQPCYTDKEIRHLCKEYADSCDISLDSTVNSLLGKVGSAFATSYDIVRHARFDVLTDGGSDYQVEKYEKVIKSVIYSNVKIDSESPLGIAKEGNDLLGKMNKYYKIGHYDKEYLESFCTVFGYDFAGMLEAYDLLDGAIEGFDIGDFLDLIETIYEMDSASTQYLRAGYYGLYNADNALIRRAARNTIPKDLNTKSFTAMFKAAVSRYVKKVYTKSAINVAAGVELAYANLFFDLLNEIIDIDKATSDYIDIKHCNNLQKEAMKSIRNGKTQVQVKYASVFYIQLSICAAEKAGAKIPRKFNLLINELLAIPDSSLDKKVENTSIDVNTVKDNKTKTQISEVNELYLYHIAYMYTNSGEDPVKMYRADVNSDGVPDLWIVNEQNLTTAIIDGANHKSTIYLNDGYIPKDQFLYSSKIGTYFFVDSTISDGNILYSDTYVYDFASNSWIKMFSSAYDNNNNVPISATMNGENIDYKEYSAIVNEIFLSFVDIPALSGSYFSQFQYSSTISSKAIADELMQYSVFDTLYSADLDGDGETDYFLISTNSSDELSDYKNKPSGVTVSGKTDLTYYWDDACLAIMSNDGKRKIGWMSTDDCYITLHKKNKCLPDGEYSVEIKDFFENYDEYCETLTTKNVFDNKFITLTLSSPLSLEYNQYLSLKVGDKVRFKGDFGEGEITFNVSEVLDDYIQLDEDDEWHLSRYDNDSECGVYGSSDVLYERKLYKQKTPLADNVKFVLDFPYMDGDKVKHKQIELKDMNEYPANIYQSIMRDDWYWITSVTIKDGKVTKIHVYNIYADCLSRSDD